MKFQMAPNSLFAVLLRSPWWISIAAALAFTAAALALLPEQFRLLGTMGAIPFAAIGLVACWRQLREPSASQVEAVSQALARMSWAQLRDVLEQAFARDGYVVSRLDAGADLLLSRAGQTTAVSARRWKAGSHGMDALQALHAAAAEHGASHCVYVALGSVSPNAQRFAVSKHIELMQAGALAKLVRDPKLLA